MKSRLPIAFCLLLFAGAFFVFQNNNSPETKSQQISASFPPPTELGGTYSKTEKIREEAETQQKKQAWFDLMHQAADGVDWKAIESETRLARHFKRAEIKKSSALTRGDDELLANDQLLGEWKERGSNNQAGRVYATEYDAEADMIWLISAGGSLFKGPRDGSDWQLVNHDLRFQRWVLKFIPHNGGRRLFAFVDDLPFYSDDDGISWTPGTGISYASSSGSHYTPVVLNDSLNTIYVLSKSTSNADIHLYKSIDHGTTFSSIQSFNTSDFRAYRMCSPHGTDQVYLIERPNGSEINMYKVNKDTDEVELLSNAPIGMGNGRTNLTGAVTPASDTIFYIYASADKVYSTTDFGANWTEKGTLPETPWGVGMYVVPSNPDFLYMGEMECWISGDAGANWVLVNDWWAYYSDVLNKLHADMMFFNEFQTTSGENFMLVSNDGGLSISTDYGNVFNGYTNIALEKLNISQYYDVRSDPTDIDYAHIFAGSQDQGFQRAFTFFDDDAILDFEQLISGDYGHISYSQNGTHLWTVYPGGSVSYYFNPNGDTGPTFGYGLESNDESVWIPPLMEPHIASHDVVYLAGGSAEGGNGSYIIRLEPTDSIEATNLPFNFKASSGGEVSAMKFSTLQPDKWYAATTNGAFYTSLDAGMNWVQSTTMVPSGHYLYGSAIYPSKLDEQTVYFGGSGYSNAPVFRSINSGASFQEMSEGLPSTLVYEIVGNEDETMLFAATEAGPYVFIVAEEKWYDMSGLAAPTQTYWSVEYLPEPKIVRFGTYGRGIWDFQIKEIVGTNDPKTASLDVQVYPNPSDGIIYLEMNDLTGKNVHTQLFDFSGKMVMEQSFEISNNNFTKREIDLTGLTSGAYLLRVKNEQGSAVRKVVLK